MPTTIKLTQDLTHREVPNFTPELAVREYFLSKFEERLAKKKPEWDLPRMTPATELVVARRELAAADERLAKKRREQEEKRKEMDKQWDELRNKEQLLKQAFIRFNKFVKENQDKRERAERKVEEEKALQARREQEIEELRQRVERLGEVRNSMEQHVKDYRIYQDYLESVVNSAAEFQTIHNILSRYETLADARAELAARQKRDLEALEGARNEMVHLTEEKSSIIMGLNNELAELQLRYDRAQAHSLGWERAVTRIKNTAAAKTLELGQVKTCCWNIYLQMCKRKCVEPVLDVNDIEHQLVDIKQTILDLKKIVHIARHRAARAGITTVSQAGSDLGADGAATTPAPGTGSAKLPSSTASTKK